MHWWPTLTSATSLYGNNSLVGDTLLLRGAQWRSLYQHGPLRECPRSRHFATVRVERLCEARLQNPWGGQRTQAVAGARRWRVVPGGDPPLRVAAQTRGRWLEGPALITPGISPAGAPPHLVWRWSKRRQPHFRLHAGLGAPPSSPLLPPPVPPPPPHQFQTARVRSSGSHG